MFVNPSRSDTEIIKMVGRRRNALKQERGDRPRRPSAFFGRVATDPLFGMCITYALLPPWGCACCGSANSGPTMVAFAEGASWPPRYSALARISSYGRPATRTHMDPHLVPVPSTGSPIVMDRYPVGPSYRSADRSRPMPTMHCLIPLPPAQRHADTWSSPPWTAASKTDYSQRPA